MKDIKTRFKELAERAKKPFIAALMMLLLAGTQASSFFFVAPMIYGMILYVIYLLARLAFLSKYVLMLMIVLNPCVVGPCTYNIGGSNISIPEDPVVLSINTEMMRMFQVFYIIVILYYALYIIFMSPSPSGRAKGKNTLMSLIAGMVLVSQSRQILQLSMDISKAVSYSIIGIANQRLTEMGAMGQMLDPTMCLMDLLFVSLGMVGIMMAGLRYFFILVMAAFFPVALFLYFIPFTKNYGIILIRVTMLMIFIQVIQSMIYAVTIISAAGETGFPGFLISIGGMFAIIYSPMIGMKLMGWVGAATHMYSTRAGGAGTRFAAMLMRGQPVGTAFQTAGAQYMVGHNMGPAMRGLMAAPLSPTHSSVPGSGMAGFGGAVPAGGRRSARTAGGRTEGHSGRSGSSVGGGRGGGGGGSYGGDSGQGPTSERKSTQRSETQGDSEYNTSTGNAVAERPSSYRGRRTSGGGGRAGGSIPRSSMTSGVMIPAAGPGGGEARGSSTADQTSKPTPEGFGAPVMQPKRPGSGVDSEGVLTGDGRAAADAYEQIRQSQEQKGKLSYGQDTVQQQKGEEPRARASEGEDAKRKEIAQLTKQKNLLIGQLRRMGLAGKADDAMTGNDPVAQSMFLAEAKRKGVEPPEKDEKGKPLTTQQKTQNVMKQISDTTKSRSVVTPATSQRRGPGHRAGRPVRQRSTQGPPPYRRSGSYKPAPMAEAPATEAPKSYTRDQLQGMSVEQLQGLSETTERQGIEERQKAPILNEASNSVREQLRMQGRINDSMPAERQEAVVDTAMNNMGVKSMNTQQLTGFNDDMSLKTKQMKAITDNAELRKDDKGRDAYFDKDTGEKVVLAETLGTANSDELGGMARKRVEGQTRRLVEQRLRWEGKIDGETDAVTRNRLVDERVGVEQANILGGEAFRASGGEFNIDQLTQIRDSMRQDNHEESRKRGDYTSRTRKAVEQQLVLEGNARDNKFEGKVKARLGDYRKGTTEQLERRAVVEEERSGLMSEIAGGKPVRIAEGLSTDQLRDRAGEAKNRRLEEDTATKNRKLEEDTYSIVRERMKNEGAKDLSDSAVAQRIENESIELFGTSARGFDPSLGDRSKRLEKVKEHFEERNRIDLQEKRSMELRKGDDNLRRLMHEKMAVETGAAPTPFEKLSKDENERITQRLQGERVSNFGFASKLTLEEQNKDLEGRLREEIGHLKIEREANAQSDRRHREELAARAMKAVGGQMTLSGVDSKEAGKRASSMKQSLMEKNADELQSFVEEQENRFGFMKDIAGDRPLSPAAAKKFSNLSTSDLGLEAERIKKERLEGELIQLMHDKMSLEQGRMPLKVDNMPKAQVDEISARIEEEKRSRFYLNYQLDNDGQNRILHGQLTQEVSVLRKQDEERRQKEHNDRLLAEKRIRDAVKKQLKLEGNNDSDENVKSRLNSAMERRFGANTTLGQRTTQELADFQKDQEMRVSHLNKIADGYPVKIKGAEELSTEDLGRRADVVVENDVKCLILIRDAEQQGKEMSMDEARASLKKINENPEERAKMDRQVESEWAGKFGSQLKDRDRDIFARGLSQEERTELIASSQSEQNLNLRNALKEDIERLRKGKQAKIDEENARAQRRAKLTEEVTGGKKVSPKENERLSKLSNEELEKEAEKARNRQLEIERSRTLEKTKEEVRSLVKQRLIWDGEANITEEKIRDRIKVEMFTSSQGDTVDDEFAHFSRMRDSLKQRNEEEAELRKKLYSDVVDADSRVMRLAGLDSKDVEARASATRESMEGMTVDDIKKFSAGKQKFLNLSLKAKQGVESQLRAEGKIDGNSAAEDVEKAVRERLQAVGYSNNMDPEQLRELAEEQKKRAQHLKDIAGVGGRIPEDFGDAARMNTGDLAVHADRVKKERLEEDVNNLVRERMKIDGVKDLSDEAVAQRRTNEHIALFGNHSVISPDLDTPEKQLAKLKEHLEYENESVRHKKEDDARIEREAKEVYIKKILGPQEAETPAGGAKPQQKAKPEDSASGTAGSAKAQEETTTNVTEEAEGGSGKKSSAFGGTKDKYKGKLDLDKSEKKEDKKDKGVAHSLNDVNPLFDRLAAEVRAMKREGWDMSDADALLTQVKGHLTNGKFDDAYDKLMRIMKLVGDTT